MQTHQEVSSGAVAHAMELEQLRSHIRRLITLEEDEQPVVSCYAHHAAGRDGSLLFERRLDAIHKVLGRQELDHFDEAYRRIQAYLATEVRTTTRGVAVFARAGARPFFLGLQFQVPLPDRLSVNSTPDIYHLVELKDTYHRYVVVISTEESARILEVNLGAITREVWAKRPELRDRVGMDWTHEHYQTHRRDRKEAFYNEKIEIIEKLMSAGGHTHLILAGSPSMTARLRASLPSHLLAKVVDVVPATSSTHVADVVESTLSSFIEREQRESRDAVAELASAVRRGALAAAGTAATYESLRRGQGDLLVMAREFEPGPAWTCGHCGWAKVMHARCDHCPECHSRDLQSANMKELMVKLAERQALEVELVQHSDVLMGLGGVGCLLRWEMTVDLGGS